jgi:GTP cyclohydrolase IIa
MIQITIIKINDYGPWTLTLGSDREHELQMLQASLYKEIQKFFSEKNSLVFLNRSDEFFAITNGLSLDDHIEIQKKLESLFDLKLSMAIGFAENPFDANLKAHEGKKSQVFLNKEYNIYGFLNGKEDEMVTILHLDVENLTSRLKSMSPYEISFYIFQLYSKMSEFFLNKKAMTFFLGGDNFMVVTNENGKKIAREFLDTLKKDQRIILNCGIGTGTSAREAAKLSTKSLDIIREIRDSGKEKPEIYEST